MNPVRPSFAPYWAGLLVVFLVLDLALLRPFAIGTDWAPVWSAARLAWTDPVRVYDFDYVTSLQVAILGPLPERPFIHPPSALLFISPFALLPFWASLGLFAGTSALLLGCVARAEKADWVLALAAPPVVLAALAGQPTLLAAALAAGGIGILPKDERAAGVLLGLAAALKPPLLLLAPVALVAGQHWRALAWATASGCVAGILSAALFGLQLWIDWFAALPRFQQLFAGSEALLTNALTPTAAAIRMGFPGFWVPVTAACLAVPVALLTFRLTHDVPRRLTAMLGGALLITPYAMNYELAALAPAVLAMRPRSLKDLVLPLVWGASMFAGASLLGLVAVYASMIFRIPRPLVPKPAAA